MPTKQWQNHDGDATSMCARVSQAHLVQEKCDHQHHHTQEPHTTVLCDICQHWWDICGSSREPQQAKQAVLDASSGLHYYFDPRDESFTFINTIAENMKQFTKWQIQHAEVTRSLYTKLSYPSMKDFKWVVQSNQIKDCPLTVQDINITTKVWGKDVAALKGKTTRHKLLPVAMNLVKIPKELLKLHKEVFLMADIFFINKIPFFLTLSCTIYFMAVNHLANRTVSKTFKTFKKIYQYYLHQEFHITTMHADGKFKPLKLLIEALPGGPCVNLASMNEHVPEIEQHIRVIKEHARATCHSMPFSRIPKLLVIHIVLKSIKLLNFFPLKGGLLDT